LRRLASRPESVRTRAAELAEGGPRRAGEIEDDPLAAPHVVHVGDLHGETELHDELPADLARAGDALLLEPVRVLQVRGPGAAHHVPEALGRQRLADRQEGRQDLAHLLAAVGADEAAVAGPEVFAVGPEPSDQA